MDKNLKTKKDIFPNGCKVLIRDFGSENYIDIDTFNINLKIDANIEESDLCEAAPELLACLIWELKAREINMGLENVKKTRACSVIEKLTKLRIQDVLRQESN